jgi:transcriptional regulator with XRE-family HTH domain
MSIFSLTFKRLLEEKKWKQKAFAEKLGVSPQTINQWASGKTTPDIDRLPQIAQILGVSLDFLLGSGGNSNPPADSSISNLPSGYVTASELLAAEKRINELQAKLIEMLESQNAAKEKKIEEQKAPLPSSGG